MRVAVTTILAWALLSSAAVDAEEPARPRSALGPVVDEVVVAVGDRFLTRSDLELEARIVLVMAGGVQGAFASIPEETVSSVLDYVINQLLILQEIDRLQVFEVGSEEIAAEYDRFVTSFADEGQLDAFLGSMDAAPERVGAVLRRNLRVQRYLESRVRLTVRVTDDEVVAFFVENSERFADRSLEEMSEAIRAYLFRERFEASVANLIDELRSRADVRLLTAPTSFPRIAEMEGRLEGEAGFGGGGGE